MTFSLSFSCDNAAFDDHLEDAIAKVLRHCANEVEHQGTLCHVIRDRNGNTIGEFRLRED